MNKRIYRVRFLNEGRIFELYARQVGQGELFGFVEIRHLLWGRKSDVIVDPSEQELKNEFAGVNKVQIPMHAVVRIDEVERSGTAKIIPLSGSGDSVARVGVPIFTPKDSGKRR